MTAFFAGIRGRGAGGVLGVVGLSLIASPLSNVQTQEQQPVAYSWGSNSFGQLGLGTMRDTFKPTPIASIPSPQSISTCGNQSAVITSNEGFCYTFGFGMDMNENIPVLLRETEGNVLDNIVDVCVGGSHGAAVRGDGQIYTWGKGWQGQLGVEGMKAAKAATKVSTKTKIKQVACGDQHTVAVDENGDVWSFGLGRNGQLGHGSKASVSVPTKIDGLKDIVQVACGRENTLCLDKNGVVYSFGGNDYGQLGVGNTAERNISKAQVINQLRGTKIVAISCGETHSALLSDAGNVYTFGLGKEGQTGHGDRMDISVPKLVKSLEDIKITEISCGGGHTCAISDKGELYCWGRGRSGQLGFADSVESIAGFRNVPELVTVFKGRNVLHVSAGGDHTIAIVK